MIKKSSLTASINKSHSRIILRRYISLYVLFKEWSKRHIKTWRIVGKLFYCDHPADFVLKLRMFYDLCFADRTNDSRIQMTMIIPVYKQVIRILRISFLCTSRPIPNHKMKQTSLKYTSLLSKSIK